MPTPSSLAASPSAPFGLAAAALLGLAVALAFPPFVALTSARVVISSDWLYQWGFAAHRTAESTGIDNENLLAAARDIVRYFTDDRQRLDTTVLRAGAPFMLFNEREVAHMVDVKHLVQLVYRVQAAALAIVLGAVLLAVAVPALRQGVAVGVLAGCLMTLVLAGLALAVALLDFDQAFLQFHLLSFTNDLWLLDPRTDYLIRLFPQGFFLGATVAIGLGALLLAAVAGAAAWLALQRI